MHEQVKTGLSQRVPISIGLGNDDNLQTPEGAVFLVDLPVEQLFPRKPSDLMCVHNNRKIRSMYAVG